MWWLWQPQCLIFVACLHIGLVARVLMRKYLFSFSLYVDLQVEASHFKARLSASLLTGNAFVYAKNILMLKTPFVRMCARLNGNVVLLQSERSKLKAGTTSMIFEGLLACLLVKARRTASFSETVSSTDTIAIHSYHLMSPLWSQPLNRLSCKGSTDHNSYPRRL